MVTESAKVSTASSGTDSRGTGVAPADGGASAQERRAATGDTPPTAAPPFEVGMFESRGVRLYYEIHGQGPRVLVFTHGILLDSNMNRRLAVDLAAAGNRVILLDLPGHGLSEKPRRASFHRMDTYARHVVNLLDHLGIDRAVIGGVSLGGNVSLLVAAQAPERIQGLVIEMPVLEWAVPAAAVTFLPLLLAVHFARPAVRLVAEVFRRLPRTGYGALDSVMNSLSSDPKETAAVLHGVLAGPIAPTVDERRTVAVPTLVIGHRSDRIHPFPAAEQLARRVPEARLMQANSLFELRVRPARLTAEIAALLDAAWSPDAGDERSVG